jgi:8-oxo-dGTP pyrophosphatase MutT (NUDIX family)
MTIAKALDAASLIIYRKQADAIEVLMGKRRKQARFAPGVYVFPGGTLEPIDNKLRPAMPFKMDGLADSVTPKIHGLAHAAIRESWEETGLLLGQKGELARTSHPTWEQCRSKGMVPAPHHLRYLGRAITPATSPTRFHARFFVAPFEHFSGSLIDEGELLDLRWVSIGQQNDLPMFDVTEFMLEELQRFLMGKRTGTPLMSYRQNRTLIRYEPLSSK